MNYLPFSIAIVALIISMITVNLYKKRLQQTQARLRHSHEQEKKLVDLIAKYAEKEYKSNADRKAQKKP